MALVHLAIHALTLMCHVLTVPWNYHVHFDPDPIKFKLNRFGSFKLLRKSELRRITLPGLIEVNPCELLSNDAVVGRIKLMECVIKFRRDVISLSSRATLSSSASSRTRVPSLTSLITSVTTPGFYSEKLKERNPEMKKTNLLNGMWVQDFDFQYIHCLNVLWVGNVNSNHLYYLYGVSNPNSMVHSCFSKHPIQLHFFVLF
uniref:CSON000738 protein n=1 Tax=Culicoides sonorensis TaxID=179676 RepID=A0A336LV24_CULSO